MKLQIYRMTITVNYRDKQKQLDKTLLNFLFKSVLLYLLNPYGNYTFYSSGL